MTTIRLDLMALKRMDMLVHLCLYPPHVVATAHDLSPEYVRQVARAMRAAGIDTHAERKARGDALPLGGLILRDKPGHEDDGAEPGAV